MPGPGDMERGVWSSSLQLAPPSLLPCPLQGPSAWPEVAARKLLPFFPSRALSFPLRRDQPANPSHRLTALSLSLSLRHDAAWIPNPKQRQSIQNTMVDVFKVGPATTNLLDPFLAQCFLAQWLGQSKVVASIPRCPQTPCE